MRKKEKEVKSNLRQKGKYAAAQAAASFLLTQILLIAASAAVSQGRLPIEQGHTLVMLCTFIGAFPISLIISAKEGRGVLKTAAAAIGIYAAMLILAGFLLESETRLSAQYLKSIICSAAGMLFGCAIYVFRKPKQKRKAKRYNKL